MPRSRQRKSHDELVFELEEYCASALLSIKQLRERTRAVPRRALAKSNNCVRAACANKRVTKAIVEHLIRLCPSSVDKGGEHTEMFPLHLACRNESCPGSAIKLLVQEAPHVAKDKFLHLGLPLHFYLQRSSRCDVGVARCLVEANPQSLMTDAILHRGGRFTPFHWICEMGEEISLELVELLIDEGGESLVKLGGSDRCYPIASLVRNSKLRLLPTEVVKYLIIRMPSAKLTQSHFLSGNVLHAACANENVTVETIEQLLRAGGIMARRGKSPLIHRTLPIHVLCQNSKLDGDVALKILKLLVIENQGSLSKKDKEGCLPIHHACRHLSTECCQWLVKMSMGCVSVKTNGASRRLPFHVACAHGSMELVRFLYNLLPEAMYESTLDEDFETDDNGDPLDDVDFDGVLPPGNYPLHLAVSSEHEDRKDVVDFILGVDPGAARREGTWGRLPLHQACAGVLDAGFVESVFVAWPKAIHTEDVFGRLPIHYAAGCHEYRAENADRRPPPIASSKRQTSLAIDFLVGQLPYSLSAQDREGRNPAHFACASSNALTKIKAIKKYCPESFGDYSHKHGLPIHFACKEKASTEVIDYLAHHWPESLETEHPRLGGPLACAEEPDMFGHLLKIYIQNHLEDIEDGTPAFHALLLYDVFSVMDPVISIFIRFADYASMRDDFRGDIWRTDKMGAYPLHYVFKATGTEALIRQLIDRFPEAIQHRDNRGRLPLHHAIDQYAPLEVIGLLIERYPGSVLVPDKQGSTPLHVACRIGTLDVEAFRHLLDKSGSVCALATDKQGCTPLHMACRHGLSYSMLMPLISSNKAALKMADNKGELPLHKACRGGHVEVIRELVQINPAAVSERNNLNELPFFILCKRSGKNKKVTKSVEYTEVIWQLLLAHPETVSV